MKRDCVPVFTPLALLLTVALTTQKSLADHELEGRDILAGAQLYADNCASCHGVNLEGQPKWHVTRENLPDRVNKTRTRDGYSFWEGKD